MGKANEERVGGFGYQLPEPTRVISPYSVVCGVQSYWTTLDPESARDRGILHSSLQGADTAVIDNLGTERYCRDIVVHKTLAPNAGGTAMDERIRVVFVDPDGSTMSFVGDDAIRMVGIINAARGDGPYDPPVQLTFRQVGEAKRNRRYTVIVGGDESATTAKRGKNKD